MNKSPLMARLKAGLTGPLPAPRPVPPGVRTRTELPRVTPCTVLKMATDQGLCRTVDCKACPHLAQAVEGRAHVWLCSSCSRPYRTLGYYADGNCAECGGYSIVLALSFRVPV